MIRIDLLLNDNAIVIQNNDAVIAESDTQHIQDTISAFPGWWKENPFDGVGIMQYYKARGVELIVAKAIQLNLNADSYNVSSAEVKMLRDTMLVQPNASR